jgi:hypothetical protein
MTGNILQATLNAGQISRLALARVDLAKLRMATENQTNFLPHILGPAQFRPGLAYTGHEVPGGSIGWLGEFYFSETQKALLVLTPTGLFFLVDGQFVSRPAVTTAITNGDFTSNITGWTDSDEAGASSVWNASGLLQLLGTGSNYAQVDQQVTCLNPNIEHGLRVTVTHNDVVLKVGATIGGVDYMEVVLAPGSYSLAFTPTGDFWIRLGSNADSPAYVDSIVIEPTGTIVLPTPWTTKQHFDALRYDQSGDVLFVACHPPYPASPLGGFQQRRIERRSANSRSWGIAIYETDDGPFRLSNISSTTLIPAVVSGFGYGTLVATRPTFVAGHLGALFRLTHSTQSRNAILAAVNDDTDAIRVSGLTEHKATSTSPGNSSTRIFAISITGTFVATIQLQRSLGEPGNWANVSGESYTAPVDKTYDDKMDNQIIYYRLICTAYTSGSANATLSYIGSAQNGIGRVTSVTNSLGVAIDVLQEFGDEIPTEDWAEGEWSTARGWPSAVVLHDGRLGWFQTVKAHLSVSDAYGSFDGEIEGDSGPINRTITTGGLDGIRWALSLQRLVVGTAAQIVSVRSSAFDEPLSPTAFTARACSDDGAAGGVRPLSVQGTGIYAGAANRLFKLTFASGAVDYETTPIDRLNPEIFAVGISDMAVQRKPDNAHVWILLKNGKAVLLTFNQKEEVEALVSIETSGTFERVAVLPGSEEDEVYFIVARTIGGVTKRFIEKLAKRSECQGGLLNKTLDSHISYTGASTATITGLSHLNGVSVVAWADGAPVTGAFVVSGGQITLPAAATNAVVGIQYTGRIKTSKLGYLAEAGTALGQKKRVSRVGLNMADVSWKGVRIGRDFDHLTGLPTTYKGKPLTDGQVLVDYDAEPGSFNGGWDPDSRVCIEVLSPYACTIKALVFHMETNETVERPPAPQRRQEKDQEE